MKRFPSDILNRILDFIDFPFSPELIQEMQMKYNAELFGSYARTSSQREASALHDDYRRFINEDPEIREYMFERIGDPDINEDYKDDRRNLLRNEFSKFYIKWFKTLPKTKQKTLMKHIEKEVERLYEPDRATFHKFYTLYR